MFIVAKKHSAGIVTVADRQNLHFLGHKKIQMGEEATPEEKASSPFWL